MMTLLFSPTESHIRSARMFVKRASRTHPDSSTAAELFRVSVLLDGLAMAAARAKRRKGKGRKS